MLETRQESTVRMKVVSLIHHPVFFKENVWLENNRPDFQKSVALQQISEIK